MTPRCILFDLDGTLTDPAEGITKSICYALERMGHVAPDPATLSWTIGPPLQSSFGKILSTECREESGRCLALYRERFAEVGLFENLVYEGIPGVLQTLRDDGFELLVATSKPLVFAKQILDHFELSRFFDGIYGSELDGTRADKSDLIAHLLDHKRLTPDTCLMVGDRQHDVHGAMANGVRCIGVLWGYGSADELHSAGACALAKVPHELVTLVKNLP